MGTPKGFNHLYDLYNLEKEDEDYKSFHFTSYDNPFADPEELAKAKRELTENRFAQEYLADFRKTEGLVYKEFNRERHLYDKLPNISFVEKYLGIDFGFTNPTGIIYLLEDRDKNYYIDDEWYKVGQTNEQIIQQAVNFKANRVYPDPEAPERILEMTNKGLNVMPVVKGKDSVVNGIIKVRELLKQNRLFINKKCLNTIWEFETYRYPDKHSESNESEEPIKDNDHLMDALRYVIMSLEQRTEFYIPPKTTNDIYSPI
jgi:phage terminase large subunit